MKPGPEILERNLEALLRCAYVPAVPRESFRRSLVENFTARARLRAGAASRGWGRAVGLAAAAVALAFLGFAWRRSTGDVEVSGPSAGTLLAAGEVAVREGADGAWRAAGDDETLRASAALLEVATPAGRGAEVLLGAGRAAVEPGSRVAFLEPGDANETAAQPELRLRRGGVTAAGVEALAVRAGGDRLEARGGVRVALEAPAASVPLPADWEDLPERTWVHVECRSGTVALAGAAGLVAGEEAFLRGGRVLRPGERVAAVLSGGGRRAVPAAEEPEPGTPAGATSDPQRPETETAQPPSPPAAPLLVGTVTTVDDEGRAQPVPRFEVVLLEEVPLPRVSQPTRHPFAVGGAGGESSRDDEGGEAGAFALADVPPGRYRVFVRAPDLALWSGDTVSLARGGPPVELDVVLERGRTVRGLVLDAATGAPVPGARVISETDAPVEILSVAADEYADGLLAQAVSGPDGGFELEHLSAAPQVLRAWAAGRAPSWAEPLVAEATGRLPEVEFELQVGGTVEGLVADDAERPVANAFLVCSMTDFTAAHPVMTYVSALTDARGRFEMHDIAAGSWAVLQFGVVADHRQAGGPDLAFVQVKGGETTHVEFRSAPSEVRYSGVLLDSAGRPLGGRAIWLMVADTMSPDAMRSTTTDAAGAFELSVPPDRYAVYLSGRSPTELTRLRRLDLTSGVELHEELHVAASTVSGRVREAQSGAGLEGITLVCLAAGGSGGDEDFVGQAVSGEDGAFEFANVAPGRYYLVAFSSEGLAQQRSDVLDVGDEPVAGVDLELRPGGALRLVVRGPDGPVPGALVRFRDPVVGWVRFGEGQRTDEQGRYAVGGMRAGPWTVSVEAADFEPELAVVEVPLGGTLETTVELTPR